MLKLLNQTYIGLIVFHLAWVSALSSSVLDCLVCLQDKCIVCVGSWCQNWWRVGERKRGMAEHPEAMLLRTPSCIPSHSCLLSSCLCASSLLSLDDSWRSQIIALLCSVFSLLLPPFLFLTPAPSFHVPSLRPVYSSLSSNPQATDLSTVPGDQRKEDWCYRTWRHSLLWNWLKWLHKQAGLQRWAVRQEVSQEVATKMCVWNSS